jgi:hypothetical protein
MTGCPARLAPLGALALLAALASPGGGQSPEAPATERCVPVTPPTVDDFGERGPWGVQVHQRTGPDGRFTLVLPDPLGEDGFQHPIATWGNGTSSVPADYAGLLSAVVSHGFVVIASDSPRVTPALMRRGLDWVIAESEGSGELAGRIATDCAVALGHSLGGGAALGASSHPKVIATVSLHGVDGSVPSVRGALLLLTSTHDGAVRKDRVTQPLYDRSETVPTVLATLDVPGFEPSFQGHLVPMGSGGETRAPTIAWLRYWAYGDPVARSWFFGSDCVLCQPPWTELQRKNGDWD